MSTKNKPGNILDEREEMNEYARRMAEREAERKERMERLLENADFRDWLYDLVVDNLGFRFCCGTNEISVGRAQLIDEIKFEVARTPNGAKILGELTEKYWAQMKENN